MPKRVEDIIPNGHRSVRDIKLDRAAEEKAVERTVEKKVPLKRVREVVRETDKELEEESVREYSRHTSHHQSGGKGMKILLGFVGGLAVLAAIGYFAQSYFSRAIFTITPKEVPVSVNSTLIANATASNGSLAYELASVGESASATVNATVGGHTETKAKGMVTVYNVLQPTARTLIAGTRFEDSKGLVYRLTSSITIPGYTKSDTGALIPGAIVTSVIADQPGSEYNVALTDPLTKMHIVAYKGDPKYESVYAKITSPISGGFKGNKVTVNPRLLASTSAELQEEIIANALSRLKSSVPEGYILYESAHSAVFGQPQVSNSSGDKATITLEGTVYGILFKKEDLISRLAGANVLQGFEGFEYDHPGLELLTFNITNLKDFSPTKKNSLIVKFKGEMKLVGIVPVEKIKTQFAGMALTDTEEIMRSYSAIIDLDKSSGQVVPPWSKIPSDPDRITVNVQD